MRRINPNLVSLARANIKQAFTPMGGQGVIPPDAAAPAMGMDPSTMDATMVQPPPPGGAPPGGDPTGGAAAAGGPPADAAAAGGAAPPPEAPPEEEVPAPKGGGGGLEAKLDGLQQFVQQALIQLSSKIDGALMMIQGGGKGKGGSGGGGGSADQMMQALMPIYQAMGVQPPMTGSSASVAMPDQAGAGGMQMPLNPAMGGNAGIGGAPQQPPAQPPAGMTAQASAGSSKTPMLDRLLAEMRR